MTDDLLSFASHIAEGVGGVDVCHDPRETVGLMELGIDLQQHFHASMEPLTRGALEIGTDEHPFRGPAFCRGLGDGRGTLLILLNEFHVAVPSALTAFRQLRLYPILIGHLALDYLAHEAIEFIEGQSLLCHSIFPII